MDWITRFLLQRAIAWIYLIAFSIVINQFPALSGERGLLPAPAFIRQIRFRDSPTLFFLRCDDAGFLAAGWLGLILSIFALSGYADAYGYAVSAATWGLLWILYLSFVNVGQVFYGFGWETLLLETGFLAIFLGPDSSNERELRSPSPRQYLWRVWKHHA